MNSKLYTMLSCALLENQCKQVVLGRTDYYMIISAVQRCFCATSRLQCSRCTATKLSFESLQMAKARMCNLRSIDCMTMLKDLTGRKEKSGLVNSAGVTQNVSSCTQACKTALRQVLYKSKGTPAARAKESALVSQQ